MLLDPIRDQCLAGTTPPVDALATTTPVVDMVDTALIELSVGGPVELICYILNVSSMHAAHEHGSPRLAPTQTGCPWAELYNK